MLHILKNPKLNQVLIFSRTKHGANRIVRKLLKKNISRTDAIFTLGGGVIGDISGFVASTVLRGVRLIHFPTTLLAQVDSSIGGKTGVNTIHGKNLVGTFYQPKLVVCDIDFLSTLPKREILSGYAEVIKYSILSDKEFFFWLKVKFNFDKIYKINDPNILQEVVKKSVFIKASLVTKDEKDVKNQSFWIPQIQRSPAIQSKITESIRAVLYANNNTRKRFLNSVGKKIYKEWNPDKTEEWIRVTFLGGGRQVGRSCILLQTPGTKILMDCGMNPAIKGRERFPYLDAAEFKINELDAIILSHAHLDHSALVPYLFKMG